MDYVAGVLTLIGVWLVGNKNKYGFIAALLSNIVWIIYSLLYRHTYGIIIECLPLIAINTRNYIKWKKEER